MVWLHFLAPLEVTGFVPGAEMDRENPGQHLHCCSYAAAPGMLQRTDTPFKADRSQSDMPFLSTSCSPSLTVPGGFVRSDSDRINGLLFSAVCKTVKGNNKVRTEEYREG